MEDLIRKISNLEVDKEIRIDRNISNIDISRPIALEHLLFKKNSRYIVHILPSDCPFELCDRVEATDCYGYRDEFIKMGLFLMELLFSGQSYIEINISHGQSEIRQLFFYLYDAQPNLFLEIEQKEAISLVNILCVASISSRFLIFQAMQEKQ